MDHRPTRAYRGPARTPANGWLDARPVHPDDLTQAGPLIERARPVWVRQWSCWHPAILLGWRRLPDRTWAAWVQVSASADVWVRYRPASLQPARPLTAERYSAAHRP